MKEYREYVLTIEEMGEKVPLYRRTYSVTDFDDPSGLRMRACALLSLARYLNREADALLAERVERLSDCPEKSHLSDSHDPVEIEMIREFRDAMMFADNRFSDS